MILQIILLFICNKLVSANNVFPGNPAQTYPIYQQNGYTNPYVYSQNDITPYLQGMMVQNQSPPSNIRQFLLNLILSSPSMQSILDSNSNSYGSNLVDYSNNQITPNLASNYFGVPTEYFNNNMSDLNKEDVVTDVKTKKKAKHSRKRSSKSKRKHDDVEGKENSSSKNIEKKEGDTQQIHRKHNKKTRKSSRKQNTESSTQVNELKNKENESHKKSKTRRKKKKDDTQNKNNPVDENRVEDVKPRSRHRKQKTDKENIENTILDEKTMPNIAEKEITDCINLAHYDEGIVEENRVPRNPKQEGNDILKSFPYMPEDAYKFFTGLPPQMNNPMMSNFFANYEKMYQSMLSENNMRINDGRGNIRRKSKTHKNKHRSTNVQKNKNTTEVVNLVANSKILEVEPKTEVVTTEKILLDEIMETNVNLNLRDEGVKSLDKTSEIKEKKMEVFDDEEFRNENRETVPLSLNPPIDGNGPNHDGSGFIDDYYPLFTDNAAYNANNREVYIKNLSDDKYFYATDIDNDFINKRSFPQRVLKDYEINKQYRDTEKESISNILEIEDKTKEEIKFRSPPFLESPDFQTRKVEKSEIRPEPHYHFDTNDDTFHRFVGDKSSSYSDAKTPHYTGAKHNGINSPKDRSHKDVETSFARSKVATYGPVYRSEEDNSYIETTTNAWTGNSYFNDGGTTYVLAKSLDYPDVFW